LRDTRLGRPPTRTSAELDGRRAGRAPAPSGQPPPSWLARQKRRRGRSASRRRPQRPGVLVQSGSGAFAQRLGPLRLGAGCCRQERGPAPRPLGGGPFGGLQPRCICKKLTNRLMLASKRRPATSQSRGVDSPLRGWRCANADAATEVALACATTVSPPGRGSPEGAPPSSTGTPEASTSPTDARALPSRRIPRPPGGRTRLAARPCASREPDASFSSGAALLAGGRFVARIWPIRAGWKVEIDGRTTGEIAGPGQGRLRSRAGARGGAALQ